MPVYDGKCKECEEEADLVCSWKEVDNTHECPACGKNEFVRVYKTMPGLTKASYIDSSKTARAREVSIHKKAANLEVAKASAKHEDRKDIQKEINNLKKL